MLKDTFQKDLHQARETMEDDAGDIRLSALLYVTQVVKITLRPIG